MIVFDDGVLVSSVSHVAPDRRVDGLQRHDDCAGRQFARFHRVHSRNGGIVSVAPVWAQSSSMQSAAAAVR